MILFQSKNHSQRHGRRIGSGGSVLIKIINRRGDYNETGKTKAAGVAAAYN